MASREVAGDISEIPDNKIRVSRWDSYSIRIYLYEDRGSHSDEEMTSLLPIETPRYTTQDSMHTGIIPKPHNKLIMRLRNGRGKLSLLTNSDVRDSIKALSPAELLLFFNYDFPYRGPTYFIGYL